MDNQSVTMILILITNVGSRTGCLISLTCGDERKSMPTIGAELIRL